METDTMGRVTVLATIENAYDLRDAQRGMVSGGPSAAIGSPGRARGHGGNHSLCPKRLIEQLGLTPFRERRVRTQ